MGQLPLQADAVPEGGPVAFHELHFAFHLSERFRGCHLPVGELFEFRLPVLQRGEVLVGFRHLGIQFSDLGHGKPAGGAA